MRPRSTMVAPTAVTLLALSGLLTVASRVDAGGATRIGGIAYLADPTAGECTEDPEGTGSDFALRMTGDLEGCLYVFVADYECSPSGTYRERGSEIFVGEYNGQAGTLETTYLFSAKLGSCPDLSTEIFGRCQHPFVRGSGTGVFEGLTGRIDFKDDLDAGNYPYRGHLRW